MKDSVTTLGLHFGALSPLISDQMKAQGLEFDETNVAIYQADADAITRLMVRGFVPASVAEKVRKKLVNAIAKEVS